jgi:hypothetical protein
VTFSETPAGTKTASLPLPPKPYHDWFVSLLVLWTGPLTWKAVAAALLPVKTRTACPVWSMPL